MSVYKDRVRFFLPMSFVVGKDEARYRTLLRKHFGLRDEDIPTFVADKIEIICRPSQFARFLIERHKLGVSNQFAALMPELVEAPKPPPPQLRFDVSTFPAPRN